MSLPPLKNYILMRAAQETRAIVLAASRGDKFAELTENRPKAMLPINGKPLLSRLNRQIQKGQRQEDFCCKRLQVSKH